MTKNIKLLYVEDDQTLSFLTRDNLEMEGYEVHHFEDGMSAIDAFDKNEFDLAILDVMLPKMDGFMIAEYIRKKNKDIPILFLTAKSLKEDKIKGLQIGGDDYITKPFSIEELLLKINIFLKRNKISRIEEQDEYEIGSYHFHKTSLKLEHPPTGYVEKLTQREADLLEEFAKQQNEIVKRSEILIKLWGEDDYFKSRSLDVFISRLRKYLSKDESLELENIHGLGFRLNHKENA